MNTDFPNIPRLFTAIAECGACMVYLCMLQKRKGIIYNALISIIVVVVSIVFLISTGNAKGALWIFYMICASLIMLVYIVLSSKERVVINVYCWEKAFLLAEFTASLEWLVQTYAAPAMMGHDNIFIYIFMIIFYGVIFVLAYYAERKVIIRQPLQQLTSKEIMTAGIMVVLTFAISNLSFLLKASRFSSGYLPDIYLIRTLVDSAGIFILYAYQSRINEFVIEKENAAIHTMLQRQYEQYRHYQDSMEMIHIQYHDLKHQIAGLRAETDAEKRKEWLDTIERELDSNALASRTGNETLDVILGVKIHQAKRNDIRITCVADGKLLNFMHVTDICSIFGNALDNALESVIFLQDPEKRMIHVSVSSQKQFIYVGISNYCEAKIDISDNKFPGTTKPDKANHGFGLKSIKRSVEKYSGTYTIELKGNWFEVRMLFPKQN